PRERLRPSWNDYRRARVRMTIPKRTKRLPAPPNGRRPSAGRNAQRLAGRGVLAARGIALHPFDARPRRGTAVVSGPAAKQLVLDADLVERLADRLVHDVHDRFRPM